MTAIAKRPADEQQATTAERTRDVPLYVPRFDIWETDEELTLCGDLPGVKAEDLEVQFENGQLTVHGRVSPRHADTPMLYQEYGVGDFYRTFTIGEAIDAAKITAELRDGVLTLHLPKTEEVKPRKIQVQSS